jgi:acyl-[acyl carrier protein]--UDP-N-acetylglucosamine O-acyltransferase
VSEEATVEPEALILQEATLHGPVVVEDGAIVSGSVILIGFIIVKAGAVITGDGILTASNSDHVLVIEGRVAARV